jgi:hypothetical protein
VTDVRYRPRGYAVVPRDFGKKDLIQWRTVEGQLEIARLRAAQIQHKYSFEIQAGFRERGYFLQEYAHHAGSSYDRMAKMLRGDVIMRLEDLTIADIVLGGISGFITPREFAIIKIPIVAWALDGKRLTPEQQLRVDALLKPPLHRLPQKQSHQL